MTGHVPVTDRRIQKVLTKAKKRIIRAARKSAIELRKARCVVDDPRALDEFVDKMLADAIRELEYSYYVFNTKALENVLDGLGRQLVCYKEGPAVVVK